MELTVLGIAADPRWQEALREAYRRSRAAALADVTSLGERLTDLQRRMSDKRQERDRAKSRTRREELEREIDQLDGEIAELEELREVPEAVADVDVNFIDRWESMTQAERRALIGDLVERIEVGPAAGRGRGFDPSRVRLHLRHVGVLHITEAVDLTDGAARTCPECGTSFPTPAALGVHRRHKHGVVGSTSRRPAGQATHYTCPEPGCGRRTTSAGGLARHVTVKHGRRDTLVCRAGCAKVFASPQDLTAHIRLAHAADAIEGAGAPAPCADCGKVLRTAHGLRVHRGHAHPAAPAA